MYQDENLAALFDWMTREAEALVLHSELTVHNRAAEIESDLANAPTAEQRIKGALNADQAVLVEKMLDIRLRQKDNEHDTAMRMLKLKMLSQFGKAIDSVANGEVPEALSFDD